MLSHVFPHIILENEGLIPPKSPIVAPLSPRRASALFPHVAESFLPDEASLHRSSTYIRHIQSELNLHVSKRQSRNVTPRAPSPPRKSSLAPPRTRHPTPLRSSFAPNEAMPARPHISRARHTTSIGSISELVTSLNDDIPPLSLDRIYSSPAAAQSNEFVQNNRRYSMFPVLATSSQNLHIDLLRAHQFSHWRSLSVPNLPDLAGSNSSLHSIPEVLSPTWPSERFYANVRRGSDGTLRSPEKKLRQRPIINRVVRKISGLFSRKRQASVS